MIIECSFDNDSLTWTFCDRLTHRQKKKTRLKMAGTNLQTWYAKVGLSEIIVIWIVGIILLSAGVVGIGIYENCPTGTVGSGINYWNVIVIAAGVVLIFLGALIAYDKIDNINCIVT